MGSEERLVVEGVTRVWVGMGTPGKRMKKMTLNGYESGGTTRERWGRECGGVWGELGHISSSI